MKLRRPSRLLLVALVCALGAFFAHPAQADCFDDAAAYQHVNPYVLRAIAWLESHNRPDATHLNDNGSVDYGVMQINSIHLHELSRYHISRATLMQPCQNVYIAAWHLHRMMENTAIRGPRSAPITRKRQPSAMRTRTRSCAFSRVGIKSRLSSHRQAATGNEVRRSATPPGALNPAAAQPHPVHARREPASPFRTPIAPSGT